MIVNNSLDEVKKRDNALRVIKEIVQNKGRENLYDLTGLSGGFIASEDELNLLETYIGPAVFEQQLQQEGLKHMGGEKVLPLNRTSSGILATILALVEKDTTVVHYLAKLPSHPSIPRSCAIVGANYEEYDDFENFKIPDNTSLVVITGSTMDHQVIDEDEFKTIINKAHEMDIPVLVDDASGARLRTVIFNQKKACDLGADIAITSTDKLMPGPRGGLMAGKAEYLDKIKVKANQFGLEAQPPSILAMVNGIRNFTHDNLEKGFVRKEELFNKLQENFDIFELTPTGVMISPEKLDISDSLTKEDVAFVLSMILLKDWGVITIPAVSMPGASPTIRFDLSTSDAFNLEIDELINIFSKSFEKLEKAISDVEESKKIVFK